MPNKKQSAVTKRVKAEKYLLKTKAYEKRTVELSEKQRSCVSVVNKCLECGVYDAEECGWAWNEDETYETFCCDNCDINGMDYNGWGEI